MPWVAALLTRAAQADLLLSRPMVSDDRIGTFAWEKYPQPFWNESNSVARALRMLVDAKDEKQAGDAYVEALQAFGNPRTGTYWPVVLPAIDFLADILEGPKGWSRAAALDVLIELASGLVPEPGFTTFSTAGGPEVEVRKDLARRIRNLMPAVERIATSPESTPREQERADELMFCISGASGSKE